MRELAAGTRAEVRAAGKRPVWFVEAEFRTVTLRMWSGMGTINWNAQTWYGPGTAPVSAPGGITGSALLEIEPVTETNSVEATALKFRVSQFPSALLRYCVDELRIGKQVNVWLGFMNLAGTALVDDPVLWFGGWMDAADVEQNPENARITITVESELRRLQIPQRRLVTLEDQHIEFPTDNLFKYIPGLKNWKGTWGSRQISGPGGGGGCFSGSMGILTSEGRQRFDELPRQGVIRIRNLTGEHTAALLVHQGYSGWMIDLGSGKLVTLDHPMNMRGNLVADAYFPYTYPRLHLQDIAVFNLHVHSEHPADRHYLLETGDVAHNKIELPLLQ